MRAMTVVPGQKGTAAIEEVRDPGMQVGALLVRAAEALATAEPGWLDGLITRRVPVTFWTEALDRQPEDIKVVVDLTV